MFSSGIVFIALGFVLGFVPLLPGFPLGILGVFLLSLSSRRVRLALRRGVRFLPPHHRARLYFLRTRKLRAADRRAEGTGEAS